MTETNLPPIEAVVVAARKRAGDNPEFVYAAPSGGLCVYVEESDGKLVGSCLVGHALIDAGLAPQRLKPLNEVAARSALRMLGYEIDVNEVGWLAAAQCDQDSSSPWGEAVAYADSRYPKLAA